VRVTRRELLIGGGALVAAGVVYRVFIYESDEEEIRELIATLASAATYSEGTNPAIYGTNVRAAFKETFANGAIIDAPELGGAALDPEQLAGAATGGAGRFASVAVSPADVKVQVQGERATATALVTVTAIDHGAAPRVELRQCRFELSEIDGDWRVTRMTVAPEV
jgi:hypothetical protein